MRYIVGFLILLLFSCKSNKCDLLDNGIFYLYENKEHVGTIYRSDTIQLEFYNYVDKFVTEVITVKKIKSCNYILKRDMKFNPKDTVTWRFKYIHKKNNVFKVIGNPDYTNSKNLKTYQAIVKRVTDLDKENFNKILDTIIKLNN